MISLRIFLAEADRVHDVARGHGDLGRVDAVGAEHRAAAALRALVEVAVPVVQHLLGEVLGADQPGEVFAGAGEVAAIDLAQQVLARDRHVFRVAGAEKVMALVGAGAAFDAGIEIDAQRPRPFDQLAEPGDRLVVPVVDQLAGKAERVLHRGRRRDRASSSPSRPGRAPASRADRRGSGLRSSCRRRP